MKTQKSHTTEDYMLPCLNKKMFGFDCPGCGFQRSAVMVTKGEFKEAFNMFPAIYTSIIFFIAVIFHFLVKKKITSKILIILAILNVSVIIIAYVLKMNKLIN
ncbi:DUF2752 domain-containing protein [Tenacibaculum sp. MEBiC06402]|uniref:DUF2752 domain-containing protein n=1 Tax=unclassified Tenacibaculum TaxID=2635139 RepID=UPI003B9ABBDF